MGLKNVLRQMLSLLPHWQRRGNCSPARRTRSRPLTLEQLEKTRRVFEVAMRASWAHLTRSALKRAFRLVRRMRAQTDFQPGTGGF